MDMALHRKKMFLRMSKICGDRSAVDQRGRKSVPSSKSVTNVWYLALQTTYWYQASCAKKNPKSNPKCRPLLCRAVVNSQVCRLTQIRPNEEVDGRSFKELSSLGPKSCFSKWREVREWDQFLFRRNYIQSFARILNW